MPDVPTLEPRHAGPVAAAFGLGAQGRLSDRPVARGQVGSIWRLDTELGSWAVKEILPDATDEDLAGIVEGAAFQEAAAAAGVPTPTVIRTGQGAVIASLSDVRVRVSAWVDLCEPDVSLAPDEIGPVVAVLHRTTFVGSLGIDPWYTEPVGTDAWRRMVGALRDCGAPFVDELDVLIPELARVEALLGRPPRSLRTCHRDLWADNVRRRVRGGLCVFDFDNAGLADPTQELAAVLVEYGGEDPSRAAVIQAAYAEAGGPGRVVAPTDFAMPIAQLGHIAEEACRRWLSSTTDAERAVNEAWVREYLDRPLTSDVIEALLAGQA